MVRPVAGSGELKRVKPAVPKLLTWVVTLTAAPVPTFCTLATTVRTWPTLTGPAGVTFTLCMLMLPWAKTVTLFVAPATEVTPMLCTASTP